MNSPCMVSIITPVFNQEKYIEETIESVLAQTYPYIEYIIVDDGSTDSTPKILGNYTGKIKIICQQNQGQSAALNNGWRLSTGTLLSYLSADDILKPNCVEEIVKVKNKSCVIYIDYDLIDANGELLKHNLCEDFNSKRLVEDLVCQPGVGAFFTREAYESAGGWDTNIRQIPDFDFWLRMHTKGDFFHLAKNLGQFRIHDQSGSVKAVAKQNSDEIIHVMSDFVTKNPEKYNNKKVLFNSYLFSSRSHFQSGRFIVGFARAFQAFKILPAGLLKISSLKFLFSGIIRKRIYQFILAIKNIISVRNNDQ